MLAIWGFVRPLRWCLCDVIARQSVATATVTEAAMWQQHHPLSHKLNMFDSCDCPCDCHTDYTNWSQSHWPAKWCDTWDMEEFFKLIESVKNTVLWKTYHKEYRRKGSRDAGRCYKLAAHLLHSASEPYFCDTRECRIFPLWNVEKQ